MDTVVSNPNPAELFALPLVGVDRKADAKTVAAQFVVITRAHWQAFAMAAIMLRTAETLKEGKGEVHDLLRAANLSMGTASNYTTKTGHIANDKFWPKVAIDPTKTISENGEIFAPLLQEFWGSVNDVTANGPKAERKQPVKAGTPTDAPLPADGGTVVTGERLILALHASMVNLTTAELETISGIVTAELEVRRARPDLSVVTEGEPERLRA